MNIFYLDHNPRTCAEMHNDKHCVKMILEYCQLLSTAHRILDGQEIMAKSKTGRNVKRWVLDDKRETLIYSATHINHPSAVWCRQSDQNYYWLGSLLGELCNEYTYRYGKVHKTDREGLATYLITNAPKNIKIGEFTEPTPAMPDDVKIAGSSLSSYRNYYINNKTHLANWKKREVPYWYKSI